MLSVYGGSASKLSGGQLLNAQTKLKQLVAEFAGEFSSEQKVRHRKLKRQQKHLLKQVGPFEIN